MLTMDTATQMFKILKQPDLKYLTQVSIFVCTSLYLYDAAHYKLQRFLFLIYIVMEPLTVLDVIIIICVV